jgi:ribonuclease HI
MASRYCTSEEQHIHSEAPYTGRHKASAAMVLLVANRSALRHLHDTMDYQKYKADMNQAFMAITGMTDGASDMQEWETIDRHLTRTLFLPRTHTAATHIPDKFLRLPADTTHGPGTLPRPLPNDEVITAAVSKLFPDESELRIDWSRLVYPDGSAPAVTDRQAANAPTHRTGSGIYIPAHDGEDEITVKLDPAGHGATNTINRAELPPIEYALRHKLGSRIASDSACSLYQIDKMIHRPMYMQKHKPMLSAICEHIRQAPEPIYMYKVPAHAGLVGNEKADELAKEPTREKCINRQTSSMTGATPMHRMY